MSFALILGGMLTTLGVGLPVRSRPTSNETRARAVESYADAAAADAAEQERVAVAALMHDSVLAALIAAGARAPPRERTLAVAMAREALTRLANTEQGSEEGSDEPRDPESLADGIERSALELGVRLTIERDIEPLTPAMPGRVARALVLASAQAIAKRRTARRRRGPRGERARACPPRSDAHHRPRHRCRIRPGARAQDRLGIRASIFARVAAVGGTSEIQSDAQGTTVWLEWREGTS